LVLCLVAVATAAYRPVVLIPGLFCGDEGGIPEISGWLHAAFPGIYIYNYTIDHWASLLVELNVQVSNLAAGVAADPNLRNGFDIVAHSQGTLVARGFIERVNSPPVHNFVSLAGPVNGVYGVPDFNELCPDNICPWLAEIMSLISEGGYTEPVLQHLVTFAQYWHDPLNYQAYLNSSDFLADVNNERQQVNATYRANFIKMNSLVLIKAGKDRIVVPPESEHFGFFALGNDTQVVPMQQTRLYTEDLFGLKTLDQAGKIHMYEVPCGHQNMPRDVCKNFTWPIIQQWTGGSL